MLNITQSKMDKKERIQQLDSFRILSSRTNGRALIKLLYFLGVIGMLILFLPWTQNIRSYGNVTALQPNQRPQTIHSIISGRIEKWYIQEGQFVKKGDTVLFISETKEDYLDPNLVKNAESLLISIVFWFKSFFYLVIAYDYQIVAAF